MSFKRSILRCYRKLEVNQSHKETRTGKWAKALALCALVAVPGVVNAAFAPDGVSVLILDTTVTGGAGSVEALQAASLALTPVVVDAATWGAMTTAEFASYRALILGDPTCVDNPGPLLPAEANGTEWGPAVTGNIVILGTDPVFHSFIAGATTLINQSIGYAANPGQPINTGLYISLSCYYATAAPGTSVPVLDPFGSFVVDPAQSQLEHIVAVSPVLGALTDPDLSGWNYSSHESFTAWPADFDVLAISTDVSSSYVAPDFTSGAPYILSRDAISTVSLTLTPPMAYNLTGTTHTVKATINGVARCEDDNVDLVCTDDDQCGTGTCSNRAGIPVGFKVSGVNNIDTVVDDQVTDANGQVEYTYADTGGPGSDTIQACADLFLDPYESTSECLSEVGYDSTDIGSNSVYKVWGDINLALTPASAYNPVGTLHTVSATIAGLPLGCSSDPAWPNAACTTNADCTVGACDLAGYPTFFAVVGECSGGLNGGAICSVDGDCDSGLCSGGPNLGELLPGVTNAAGVATTSYSSVVEGEDRIQACLDGDPYAFNVHDEIYPTLVNCINEIFEFDYASNVVTKSWFANFITGGAGTYATVNRKKTMQFSGIIGKAGQAGIQGQWNAVAKDGATGKTVSCHFNTFTKLVFSGPPAKTPASTHNTATWTTGPGKCNDGSTPILTAIAVDYGEGRKLPRDTINVKGDIRFDTGGTKALTTGNLQVHSIILP